VEAQPGDLIVARLWRWDVERLRLDAETDYRERVRLGQRDPYYSISAWALRLPSEGDVEATVEALFVHIRNFRTARWAAVTTDRRLRSKGFDISISEPPPKHYDVVLGRDLAAADFDGLEAVFNEDDRRRFR